MQSSEADTPAGEVPVAKVPVAEDPAAEDPAPEDPAPEAPAFQYVVPDWFLHNIKTADEVKDLHSNLWLVDEAEKDCQKKPEEDENASCEGTAAQPDETPGDSKETCQACVVQSSETATDSDTSSECPIATPESSWSGSEDGQSSCFRLSRGAFEDVLDAAASLYVSEQTRRFVNRGSSLGLYSQMRQGYEFVDEVVVRAAQALGAALVSLHPYDLEDMAVELYDQECAAVADGRLTSSEVNAGASRPDTAVTAFAYAERMFGARAERKADEEDTKRSRNAVFAILDAARKRCTAEEEKQPGNTATTDSASHSLNETQTPPLILYVRDALRLFDTDTARGRHILCRMRDAVNKRREAGQNIFMAVAVTHTDVDKENAKVDAAVPWRLSKCACVLCECDDLVGCNERGCDVGAPLRKLGARGLLQQQLWPLGVPAGWGEPRRRSGSLGSPTAVRLLSFQRKLRARLADYPARPPDLLAPDCDWLAQLSDRAVEGLGAKLGCDLSMQTALARVVGKSIRRRAFDLADLEATFVHLTEAVAGSDMAQDDAGLSKDEKAWEAKLAEIKQHTSEYEDNLLPCLVDPASLNADFDDVVLDPDVLARIKTLVHLSQLRPEAASKLLVAQIRPTGALLYGPPGTGKTLLARAVARTAGAHMLAISPAAIESKWSGESEKTVAAVFTLARRLFPCIVFIDEADALFYRRGCGDAGWQRSQLTQFLQELDGLAQNPRAPFVLAATNRPADLDSAFLRRLPHRVPFGAPDAAARARILRVFLKPDDLDPETVDLDRLAEQTPGFSGSDLRSLCGQAGLAWAVEQDLAGAAAIGVGTTTLKVRLTGDHFRTALAHLQPSIASSDLNALEMFTQQFGPAAKVPRDAP